MGDKAKKMKQLLCTLMLLASLTGTANAQEAEYLGSFRITAYCPCYQCSEGWGRQTSTGATATAGHTIAVDPKTIPYGTKVMIDGVIYTAEDCGGGVKGNHIDIFYETHSETVVHGVKHTDVYVIKE